MRSRAAKAPTGTRVFLGQLEGLRALALGVVVLFHTTAVFAPDLDQDTSTFLLQVAFQGLIVFFVMSGALLSTWFLQRTASEDLSPGMVGDYARLRIARILPGYWVAFIGVALLSLTAIDRETILPGVDGGNLWIYLTLLQDYFESTRFGGLVVVWSLSVEVTFYAALPLMFGGAWLAAKRGWAAADVVFATVSALLAIASLSIALADPAAPPTVANLYWHIGLGSILAVVRIRLGAAGGGSGWVLSGRIAGLLWVGAAALFCAVFIPDLGSRIPVVTYGVVATMIMTASMLSGRGWFGAAVTLSRPARWIGEHSYGIFLWHIPVLGIFGGYFELDAPVGVPVALAATTVIALLSYRLIELPAMRWARRTTNTRRPVEVDA